MEKVSVSKGVLIGVVAVAAASLLAVAFLLGRVSGPAGSAAPDAARELTGRAPSPVPEPRVADLPLPLPTPAAVAIPAPAETRPPGPAPFAPELRNPLQEAGRPAPASTAGVPPRAVPDPERAAVAAYLDAVGRIQPASINGDTESVANAMAASLAKGDTSDLDKLIRETEVAKASLAALTPPPSCVTHHGESLGSLEDALEMLRSMKTAMESPDPVSQLTGVANRATGLRSRAEALQREEQALRERYGLKR